MLDERLDEEWRLWRCVDCDPTMLDESDDEDHPAREFEKPYLLILPQDEPHPDYCPRCRSYLSFTEGSDHLTITTKWQRRRAEEAASSTGSQT